VSPTRLQYHVTICQKRNAQSRRFNLNTMRYQAAVDIHTPNLVQARVKSSPPPESNCLESNRLPSLPPPHSLLIHDWDCCLVLVYQPSAYWPTQAIRFLPVPLEEVPALNCISSTTELSKIWVLKRGTTPLGVAHMGRGSNPLFFPHSRSIPMKSQRECRLI